MLFWHFEFQSWNYGLYLEYFVRVWHCSETMTGNYFIFSGHQLDMVPVYYTIFLTFDLDIMMFSMKKIVWPIAQLHICPRPWRGSRGHRGYAAYIHQSVSRSISRSISHNFCSGCYSAPNMSLLKVIWLIGHVLYMCNAMKVCPCNLSRSSFEL